MMRFPSRVALLARSGEHVRYIPGALADALVASGAAATPTVVGRVREISLVTSASAYAQRIGEPTGRAVGVRFTRWQHLDTIGMRVIEHHPRCLY